MTYTTRITVAPPSASSHTGLDRMLAIPPGTSAPRSRAPALQGRERLAGDGIIPPSLLPQRGLLTHRGLPSHMPSCSSSVPLPPPLSLRSSMLALVVHPRPSASCATCVTCAVQFSSPPTASVSLRVLCGDLRLPPQMANPAAKAATSPCRFLPLLPPIIQNVKLPIRVNWLECGLCSQSPAKTPSKNGKNGNVDWRGQHCPPHLQPLFSSSASSASSAVQFSVSPLPP